MSSVSPAARYARSGSLPRFSNGSTASVTALVLTMSVIPENETMPAVISASSAPIQMRGRIARRAGNAALASTGGAGPSADDGVATTAGGGPAETTSTVAMKR